jgi:hypothetical protein
MTGNARCAALQKMILKKNKNMQFPGQAEPVDLNRQGLSCSLYYREPLTLRLKRITRVEDLKFNCRQIIIQQYLDSHPSLLRDT